MTPNPGPLMDRSHTAYAVECPTCGQRPWAPCFDLRHRGTKHRRLPHPARISAAPDDSPANAQ